MLDEGLGGGDSGADDDEVVSQGGTDEELGPIE